MFVILADRTEKSPFTAAFPFEVKKSMLTVRKSVKIYCRTFEEYARAYMGLSIDT